MIDFFFDFETRSRIDLRKVGVVKYATDPSTQATLLTWCFGHGPVKAWCPGMPVPADLADVCLHPEKYNMVAHNVAFDFMIWTIPWKKVVQHLGPLSKPKVENLTCSMAMTNHFGAGANLDGAARVLHMPYTKDGEGRRLMLKQCKPDAKTGKFPILTPEEFKKFENYGIIDTKLMRDIYYKIPQLPYRERWAWEWTHRRNLTGIRIDMPLLKTMEHILKQEIPGLEAEFSQIVGGQFRISQRQKAKAWFQQFYPHMQDMQKDTVRDTLAGNYNVPAHIKRALEIYSLAGSASIGKVRKALDINYHGRIYETLKYHEAHTKRWAGQGIQIQNFPRSAKIEGLDLDSKDLASQVKAQYIFQSDGVAYVKNLLRRLWLPDASKYMYCGDFAKVEPTVLFWLTGLGTIPPKWYEEMAAEIYGCSIDVIGEDSEERNLGKAANLGCGYNMGPPKFKGDVLKKTGMNISIELAKRAVYAYRHKYWQVPNLWRNLEAAFKAAVAGQTVSLCEGKLHVGPIGNGLRGVKIRLPSGSFIHYHDASSGPSGLLFTQGRGGKAIDKNTYGGLLTEHVVSATARDIMLTSMYNLEQAGFDVMNTVHDEVWAQTSKGRSQEFEEVMCRLPKWCGDLKVGVESKNGVRYLK